jgi:transcription-repair coupling factor (superfamily II helicase)
MVAKRLASVRDQAQLGALRDEVRDRYGALPREVEELFDYSRLRLDAEALGILSADRVGRNFELRIGRDAGLDLPALVERVKEEPGWSIRPPDRLVVCATEGESAEGAVGGAELSPVVALRTVLERLPQTGAGTA